MLTYVKSVGSARRKRRTSNAARCRSALVAPRICGRPFLSASIKSSGTGRPRGSPHAMMVFASLNPSDAPDRRNRNVLEPSQSTLRLFPTSAPKNAFPRSPPRGSDYNGAQCDMRREESSMKEASRSETEQVAGNGLLHRRMFLAGGAAAMGAGAMVEQAGAAPLAVESWMKIPGAPF